VPAELEGWFLSPVFPTFRANPDRLDVRYLEWFGKQSVVWDRLRNVSRGMGARRDSVHPDKFLSIEIPLPPLEEQRRVVARIDSLFAKHEEALLLRNRLAEEHRQLCLAILRDQRYGPHTPTKMHELVILRKSDVEVQASETYDFAGVYCFGRGVFRGQRRSGSEFAYKQLTQIRAGEFIYPKLMAWEGALGIVPKECDGLFVSPEFPVFTVREDRVLPEVLDTYFRSSTVWPLLSGASTGTNVRRRRLNPNDFLNHVFPLPTMESQIALRNVRRKLSEIELSLGQKQELNKLLPSILDRAFQGGL
jgi:type I restriction enzyme S subunit